MHPTITRQPVCATHCQSSSMADGGGRARRLLSLQTDGRVTCASAHIGETAFVLSGADTGAVHLFQVNNGSLVAVSRGSLPCDLRWPS